MESQILVEQAVKYDTYGSAIYCLESCKYLRNHFNNGEFVYKNCMLFGDFLRYILVPRIGRVALRHKACIECEQRHDSLKGDKNA
jgi:hypothetical protein